MDPKNSREELCNRLAEQSLALNKLNAAQGFDAMLAFYEECRADGCDIDDDGDMLLCQWGAQDGDQFVWNITRQFMTADEDEPYQLSLTFRFDSSAELAEADSKTKWCDTPDHLPDFRATIDICMFYRMISNRPPNSVELVFEQC